VAKRIRIEVHHFVSDHSDAVKLLNKCSSVYMKFRFVPVPRVAEQSHVIAEGQIGNRFYFVVGIAGIV
jgi:hypothetical protein